MTGKRPGTHGIYDFRVYDPRSYRDSFVTSRALRDPTIWQILTAAARRTAVVGLPLMYPPPPAAGTIVSGFDTPSTEAAFTHPAELRARILERFPDYLFVATPDPSDRNLEGDGAFERFAANVERACEQRTQVALDLLEATPHDALMVHYQDVDALQHSTWRFLEDPKLDPGRWERLRRVYRHLDALLGRLVAAVSPDTLVLVVSDHGFGAHDGRLFPNALLHQWGYLGWHGRRRQRFARSIRKRLARLGLTAPVRSQQGWDERIRECGFRDALPIHWRRTRAYVAVAEIYGLLYLNLHGREPEGTVAPGAEAEALVAEIAQRLRAVRDPRDDVACFADVLRGEDIYPFDPHGRRPDLVLVPRAGYSVYRDLNHRLWIDHYRVRGGTHRPEGIILLSGTDVRSGPLPGDIELIDLAPTLLAAAGVAVPNDMEGRVLTELFTNPPHVSYSAPLPRDEVSPAELSTAEENEVTARLRALGYLS